MLVPFTNHLKIAKLLQEGKIGVLPTDTIYGIHCLASDPGLIHKVVRLKQRDADMPMITLISATKDLQNYGIQLNGYGQAQTQALWPGPNTLIFQTQDGATKSFRIPQNDFLLKILEITGSLVSTSANLHGGPHSTDVKQAIKYFGNRIDFYVDGGLLDNAPSSVYRVLENSIEQLR